MKIVLDFDDFSVLGNRFDLLLRLKEHYPNLKLSLFTIPYDYIRETSKESIIRDKFLATLHDNLDWMELIPHGLMHIPREFENCDKETMQMTLKAIDEVFKKDGLPYVKGFKAPYWLWNEEVVSVLDENGWWGAVDRNQPKMVHPKRFYRYSHSIDETFWDDEVEVLKLHGHMFEPDANNLEDNFLNLMKMPHDAQFVFASELVEEHED